MSVTTEAKNTSVSFDFWDGQQLQSQRELPLAFDVETEAIEDPRQVPRLALATASNGTLHVVVHPDDLGEFLEQHRDCFFVGHNVQFDFWVVDEHLALTDHPARRVLWEACHQGRLFDTMILDMLLQLGTGEYRSFAGRSGSSEQKVYPVNLAVLAAEYTTLELNKEDPYRLRFGELIGLPHSQLQEADPGFFEYAVLDVAATHRLYPALTQAAYELMIDYGYRRDSHRFEIRPDAIGRFGYLSEVIQVKASIVLSHMFRHGVHVDQDGVNTLIQKHRGRVEELTAELRQDFPDALEILDDKQVRLTPKSQTPSFGTRRLIKMLTRVSRELQQLDEQIDIPQNTGTTGGISRSAKAWSKYAERHRFLAIWIEMKSLEKLLGILSNLDADVLHCQYGLLTRTGRTSCSKPRDENIHGINLQQIPNSTAFRGLFVPRTATDKLFIADYSAIELRTLATVCLAKYGRSELAGVFAKGIDPHAFTAAAIQNVPLDEFMLFKKTDPDRFRQERQAAKAINFGVPGGLGARTLRAYALTNYGVSLTEEQAEAFRRKLISDIYPELNDRDGYISDQSMATLARNLGVPESVLWDAFDFSGERKNIAARGVANVIGGRSQASATYQRRVWTELDRLCGAFSPPDYDLVAAIVTQTGNPALRQRLYHQKTATLTGRIRDGVGFTDSKNTPFQSLAADGSKIAFWNLLYAGFDVYGFVHDEIMVNLPSDKTEEDGQRIAEIMENSMREVLGEVPAACEWTISHFWSKPD
ncbi:MAG: DNA polymerase [Pirellulales bacterium]